MFRKIRDGAGVSKKDKAKLAEVEFNQTKEYTFQFLDSHDGTVYCALTKSWTGGPQLLANACMIEKYPLYQAS